MEVSPLARLQPNWACLWKTMLEQGEGEVVLFILQITFFCWLQQGEKVRLMDITGWMVRRVLMGPKAKGKVRPKAEAEGLGDSRASAITQVPVTIEGLVRVGKNKGVMTLRTWPWMKSIRRGRERLRDRERPGPSENQAIVLSARKTLRSSICFGKLVIFNEAILRPRLEGRKVCKSELKLLDSIAAASFVDGYGLWNCRNSEWAPGTCAEGGSLELRIQYQSDKNLVRLVYKTDTPWSLRCSPPSLRWSLEILLCLNSYHPFWLQHPLSSLFTVLIWPSGVLSADLVITSDIITSARDSLSIIVAKSTMLSVIWLGFGLNFLSRSFVPTWG